MPLPLAPPPTRSKNRKHKLLLPPPLPSLIALLSRLLFFATRGSGDAPPGTTRAMPSKAAGGQKDGATKLGIGSRFLGFLARISHLRTLVSKKRRRLVLGGYDLDISYITDRLVAMSFPAQDMRAMYRNPMWEVRRALDARHGSHYKVYNLCAESCYDSWHFYGRVEVLPFDDMQAPPLLLIKRFCESVHEWLENDPENVAVVHCMAGKGRTGCMVGAYLVYKGMPVDEALQLYAERRTYNNEGVTIASQRRYVRYWSRLLDFSNECQMGLPSVCLPLPRIRELRRIRLYDTVFGDRVKFVIFELKEISEKLYQPPIEVAKGYCKELNKGFLQTVSPRYYHALLPTESGDDEMSENKEAPHLVVQMDTEKPVIYNKTCLDHYFSKPLPVCGDVRLVFFDNRGGQLFHTCFNTSFIAKGILQLSLRDLDKVTGKAKSICGPSFCLELFFGPAEPFNLPLSSKTESSFDSSLPGMGSSLLSLEHPGG